MGIRRAMGRSPPGRDLGDHQGTEQGCGKQPAESSRHPRERVRSPGLGVGSGALGGPVPEATTEQPEAALRPEAGATHQGHRRYADRRRYNPVIDVRFADLGEQVRLMSTCQPPAQETDEQPEARRQRDPPPPSAREVVVRRVPPQLLRQLFDDKQPEDAHAAHDQAEHGGPAGDPPESPLAREGLAQRSASGRADASPTPPP